LVAARSGDPLSDRLAQAAAITAALAQPPPRPFSGLPLRSALTVLLDELLGPVKMPFEEESLAVAHRARFVVPVLEAQAIADRGERALLAMSKGEASVEATRMAEELATVHLRHAVTEALAVTDGVRATLAEPA
jgi:hypothetical protein